MVLETLMIVPVLAIATAWLFRTIIDMVYFLYNFLLGLDVLMWFIFTLVSQLIYNCWWYLASSANSLVAWIWSRVLIPTDAAIHIIKHFGLLSLSVTHLVLRVLYYIFLLWVFVYLLMLLYRFITHCDWAIQLELYIRPTLHHDNLRGGEGHTLTLAPVLLDQHRRQRLNPPHIILSGSPSALSAHPVGVQHAGSHTPSLGYGLPLVNQSPAQWWGPWGPPLPWAQYYQQWSPLAPLAGPTGANTAPNQQNSGPHQWQQGAIPAYQPPMASYNSANQDSTSEENGQQDQSSMDPLVNALAVSTVPGKQPEPILSMHISQSIKKCIWAGEYIDLAYLLEANLVPEDEKSNEFACTSNSANKLSLTTAKPKAKIESYNTWNKAFRVLTEIVVLCDPSQCLPMT